MKLLQRIMAGALTTAMLFTCASAYGNTESVESKIYKEYYNIDFAAENLMVTCDADGSLAVNAAQNEKRVSTESIRQLENALSESESLYKAIANDLEEGKTPIAMSCTTVYVVSDTDENGESTYRLATEDEVERETFATGNTEESTNGKLSIYSYASRLRTEVTAKAIFDWDYNILEFMRNTEDAVGLTWEDTMLYNSSSSSLDYTNAVTGKATLSEWDKDSGAVWYFKTRKTGEDILGGTCKAELEVTATNSRHYIVAEYILTEKNLDWNFGLGVSHSSESGYEVSVDAGVSEGEDSYERILSPLYFVY